MRLFLIIVFVALLTRLQAQVDSNSVLLQEVQVTGYREGRTELTALNISILSKQQLQLEGGLHVSDALSRCAGISQLTTGPAISKPVIRGLAGNRVLVLLSGLRFDNQQWQEEHGLGLSNMGIGRVEIVKGPLAVLYGSDAVGGLINIIEEDRAPEGKTTGDVNVQFHTNTLGIAVDAGVKSNRQQRWWSVRLGAESHGDYADGKNQRILNSRFNGYYGKFAFGTFHKKWNSENHYNFSYNDYAFILNDIYSFIQPDARWSRSMQNPHHNVILHLFSSQNSREFQHSKLQIDAGVQINQRKEDEGGGSISLNMLLSTIQYQLQYRHRLNNNTELILRHFSAFENNTNFGGRKIIPDANMLESGAALLFRFSFYQIILETGASLNFKWIKTLETPTVNSADKLIWPFSQQRFSGNGCLGISWNPDTHWNLKINAASGMRAPNLAELSSNGLHEGIFTYEIGNPNLKNERNLNFDFSMQYHSRYWQFSGSTFYNQFFNYIFFQPTSETFYGFPVFRINQKPARLTGAEAHLAVTPQGPVTGLELSETFSSVYGIANDGKNLPFMPPPKMITKIFFGKKVSKTITKMFGSADFDYIFRQNQIAPNETSTAAYYLFNASVGATFKLPKTELSVSVLGSNLLNAQYYDHLSRFKNYGLHNTGRNIRLMVNINW